MKIKKKKIIIQYPSLTFVRLLCSQVKDLWDYIAPLQWSFFNSGLLYLYNSISMVLQSKHWDLLKVLAVVKSVLHIFQHDVDKWSTNQKKKKKRFNDITELEKNIKWTA